MPPVATVEHRHDPLIFLSRFLHDLPAMPAAPGPAVFWTAARLAMVAVLTVWETAAALSDRFRLARATLSDADPSTGDGGRTYQGWVKALAKATTTLGACLIDRLRAATDASAAGRRRCGRRAFAADGSRFDAPRTAGNRVRFGCAGKPGSPPQMQATVLWCMSSGLPWDWRLGAGTVSERLHLREMVGGLPAGALLVADAGFVGYELLSELLGSGRSLLMRVGANVRLLRGLGFSLTERGDTVYLWPLKRRERPPLTLRLLRVSAPGKADVCLLTDVRDESELTFEQAGTLYRMRWGVEVFFRSAKQTLGRRKMLSGSPDRAAAELHWTFIGFWVVGLAGVQELLAAGEDPLELSFAAALRAARAAARRPRRCGRPPPRMFLRDRYVRKSVKASRDWPHKKTQSPPGEPDLRDARDDERRAAETLRAALPAA